MAIPPDAPDPEGREHVPVETEPIPGGIRIRPIVEPLSDAQAARLKILLLSFGLSDAQAEQLVARMNAK